MPIDTQLSAKQLAIGYQQGAEVTTVAEGIDLSLRGGEFVCLLGPNGAGKSTLIRTLAGMQAPLSGELQLSEQSLGDLPPRERAKAISVVLTETLPSGMMDATSLVSLGRHPYSGWFGGLTGHDHERIAWALDAVGATPLAQRQVAELSDGERQKVSIARALAQEAKVMLLDEPTAYLDLPRRVELMSLLRSLAHRENLGLLLSTHDLDLALRFSDCIWMLTDDGELIQGYPEALALDGQLAAAFANENIEWDTERGAFRAHREACLEVYMSGESTAHTWTRRALERLGYGITTKPDTATFSIEITHQAEQANWELNSAESTQSFAKLSECIEWISNR